MYLSYILIYFMRLHILVFDLFNTFLQHDAGEKVGEDDKDSRLFVK
jgi:hypothetical protein